MTLIENNYIAINLNYQTMPESKKTTTTTGTGKDKTTLTIDREIAEIVREDADKKGKKIGRHVEDLLKKGLAAEKEAS